MKVFITSDTFFGRKLNAVSNGFETLEEMEDQIIENWNEKVKPNDVVYHLGNFGWDPISTESSIIHLNGTIFFVGGEYDKHLSENSLIKVGKHHLLPVIAEIPKLNLVLSHWALENWLGKSEGTIHLHGGEKSQTKIDKRFCVNVKNWNWSPVEYDFIKEIVDGVN